MESFVLSNGMNIPAIGFGCYALNPPEQKRILLDAIEAGYRHFDTASFYQTEEALGQAVRESGLPREAFFLTTKLWRTQMDDPRAAFEASLRALGTDYLDLYLIHWPRPDLERSDWKELDARVWDCLQELYQQGKVRAIGTSNFLPHHLMNLAARGGLLPMVNQLEYHPGYLQSAAVQYCRENHIQVSAWSPLGRRRLMDDPPAPRDRRRPPGHRAPGLPALRPAERCAPSPKVLQSGADAGKPGPVPVLPVPGGDVLDRHHASDRLVRGASRPGADASPLIPSGCAKPDPDTFCHFLAFSVSFKNKIQLFTGIENFSSKRLFPLDRKFIPALY